MPLPCPTSLAGCSSNALLGADTESQPRSCRTWQTQTLPDQPIPRRLRDGVDCGRIAERCARRLEMGAQGPLLDGLRRVHMPLPALPPDLTS